MVKASKYTILDQKRRAKLQDQKSKISRMPKISLPKKPVVMKQELAEELANTHRFSHESNKKIMSTIKKEFIKQEFIKMELSPELQKQKEKIMQMMPKIPLTKGTIIKQDIKTQISPRLQKQLEKIRKHMPKISLPRKRKSDLVNENGNSNQNENDPDDAGNRLLWETILGRNDFCVNVKLLTWLFNSMKSEIRNWLTEL